MRNIILAALTCAAAAASFPLRASGAFDVGVLSAQDAPQTLTFQGSAGGGIGSAALKITVTEAGGITTVVADIWNTSPTSYDGGRTNFAAITGFGFDILPDTPILSYSIVAQQWNGSSLSTVLLGDGDPAGNMWSLVPGGGSGNFTADIFADNGTGIAGALYNPELAGNPAIGNTSPFFTGAQLTVSFASPLLVELGYYNEAGCEVGLISMPIVRMQRVGDGGSLKLEPELPTMVNPEPHTLVIWTVGAGIGLLLAWRRRIKSQCA